MATMESIGDPAELGGPAKDAVAESGNGASADPRGTTAGTWARRRRVRGACGPGGEGAPERRKGEGSGAAARPPAFASPRLGSG